MASHPAATKKTYEHLEILVNGAAPLAASDVERFCDKAEVLHIHIFFIFYLSNQFGSD